MSAHVVITTFEPPVGMLAGAVASALACEGVERVTVVDDGSPRAVDVGHSEPRLEIIRQANAGPSAARNAGLDRVRSDWAILLDDDDELIASGVSDAMGLADRLGAAGAVVGRVSLDQKGRQRERTAPAEWAGRAMPRRGDAFRPIQLFNASGTLVARRAIDSGVRFDSSLRIGEDREFIRRLSEIGPIAVVPGVAVRCGCRPGGERLTSQRHLIRRATDHMAIMERWLDEESEPHFGAATRWLLRAMSKAGLHTEPTYRQLLRFAADRRWIGPIERLRLAARRARSGGLKDVGESR